jgi:Arc/MetJ-type ribon-helix-helix transcriptional regulator
LQAVADEERTSKAEILRRALRLYLEEMGHRPSG